MSGVVDLADIDEGGFIVTGPTNVPNSFASVSGAGDVNGDGFDDFIVGLPSDATKGNNAGAAYVIYGDGSDFGTIGLATLVNTRGFAILGDQAGDRTGYSVSAAGDVNGDGFDDVIVGADRAQVGGDSAGAAHIIFGSGTEHGTINTSTMTAAQGITLRGAASGDRLGLGVSSAGDVNDDGLDDLIIGANASDLGGAGSGAAYVIYGQSSGFGTINLANLGGAVGFAIIGDSAGDSAGRSVSSAGDINGDGIDDIMIGAPGNDDGGNLAGEAYIVFGIEPTRGPIDLTTMTAAQGFAIRGTEVFESVGFSVSDAGDVNGDGIGDLIVAAPGGNDGGAQAGGAYVIYGRQTGFAALLDLNTLTPTQGFFIQGDRAGDYSGFSVSGAGDFDGDGIDDLIVGAAISSPGIRGEGSVYIVYGRTGTRATLNLSDLNAGDGLILRGDVEIGAAGAAVSDTGDVNGDGFDDIILGAPGTTQTPDDIAPRGRAFVVYGRDRGSLEFVGTARADALFGAAGDDVIAGRDGDDFITGAAGNDALLGGAGSDTLIGGDDDDELSGGSGNDTVQGGDGDDMVRGSSGNDTVDGGDGDDVVAGNSGDDQLFGGEGSDHLIGGSGNDRLDGGPGADTMVGGSGNDLYIVNSTGDRVIEDDDAGRDRVNSAITYSLGATFVEDLTLLGSAAINGAGNGLANVITGNAAENGLTGGAGNDILIGGAGKDILTGGAGTDQFRFADGDTSAVQGLADRITDFNRTEFDTIALNLIDANAATGANDAFTFIGSAAFSNVAGQLRYATSGAVTFVYGDTNGDSVADLVLRVDGVIAFVAADFVL